jgi:cytochrome P450
MPPVATSLPVLPVELPAFFADPNPYLEAARREHPWLATFSQGYVVHGYQAASDLLADDEHLITAFGGIVDFYGARGTMWARFMEEMVMARSGPAHTRLRASVAHAFTPRRANELRGVTERIISELLDEWAPKGEFDFALFASYFPVTVICGMLGVSAAPIPGMRSALENQLASFTLNPDIKPLLMSGWEVLWRFVDGLVTEREASGGHGDDSLLDDLVAARNSGQMDETELRFMLLILLVAGYDTSKNQLTLLMKLLLERPEIYARCAEDKEYCGKVVQEALRHSAVANTFRVVTKAFTYDGVRFREGDMLAVALTLAGRDPSVFPDPLTFDPERENAPRHLAFGRGAHICVGQFLARNQLQEGLHAIAKRLKNPRLNGEIAWRPFLGVWGLERLPITFEPG